MGGPVNDAILAELQAELARFSDRQLWALLELTLREMEGRELLPDPRSPPLHQLKQSARNARDPEP